MEVEVYLRNVSWEQKLNDLQDQRIGVRLRLNYQYSVAPRLEGKVKGNSLTSNRM